MKRIMLAFSISFLLICFYLILASFYVALTDYKIENGSMIDYPLRLPKLVFFYFSPPNEIDFAQQISTRKLIAGVFTIIGNLVIYSIPVYLTLLVFAKRKAAGLLSSEPPVPPNFENRSN